MGNKVVWLDRVRLKLVQYENEYNRLKEATIVLELALWKYKMEESDSKKRKRDFREQSRISCRADIVIEHVLPFLMPSASSCEIMGIDESDSDESSSSSSSDDDDDNDNESSDGSESE